MQTPKQTIIDSLSVQCFAEASPEYDGHGHFTSVSIGSPDAPTVLHADIPRTPEIIAYLKCEASKEIEFSWSGDYVENETEDPQKDVSGSVELELVAHREAWRIDKNSIHIVYHIETL